MTIGYPGEGRRRYADIGTLLPGHSAVNPALWIIYVGGEPLHWWEHRGVTQPYGTADYGELITATSRWDLSVPPVGGDNEGGRLEGDRDIYAQAKKYDFSLHSN